MGRLFSLDHNMANKRMDYKTTSAFGYPSTVRLEFPQIPVLRSDLPKIRNQLKVLLVAYISKTEKKNFCQFYCLKLQKKFPLSFIHLYRKKSDNHRTSLKKTIKTFLSPLSNNQQCKVLIVISIKFQISFDTKYPTKIVKKLNSSLFFYCCCFCLLILSNFRYNYQNNVFVDIT